MSDLLPCPFCGSEALERGDPNARLARWVNCKGCNADMVGKTLDEAITKWNRRTPASTVLPERSDTSKSHQIAAIVETYTDILSPETARKVASRIRSLREPV